MLFFAYLAYALATLLLRSKKKNKILKLYSYEHFDISKHFPLVIYPPHTLSSVL